MPHEAGEPPVEAWLNDHGDRLLRSAYLLCGDATEAEDLVQETLLQAVKAAPRFRGESAVYTWLYGILLNLARHHRRRRHRLVLDEAAVLAAAAEPRPAMEGDLDYSSNRIIAALATLSPEHREVIVLRFYDKLKLQEIAERTGMSLGTTKSRLHYAMRCLESALPRELNLLLTEGTQTQTTP